MERVYKEQIWRSIYGTKDKEAELSGTWDMPLSPPPRTKERDEDLNKAKGEVTKVGFPLAAEEVVSDDDLLKAAFAAGVIDAKDPGPGTNLHTSTETEEAPKKLTQAKVLDPKVDVSGTDTSPTVVKRASRYALPLQGKYPLDSYGQVKAASAYFDEWYKQMEPQARHEFCVNMVKRASELAIPVSDLAKLYGATTYAPEGQIAMAIEARKLASGKSGELLDKLAAARAEIPPLVFAEALGELDKVAGIDAYYDSYVPDPYFSTFGKDASVHESEVDPNETIIIGNHYVPAKKIVRLASLRHHAVCKRFGKDFADDFAKDPMGIFESMPRDEKIVLLIMARNNDSDVYGATTS